MSADTGLNQAAAQAAIDNIIAGGADVRLMTTALNYDDTATELDSKEVSAASYAAQNVAETAWSVTFDTTNGTATLTNDNQIDFGQAQEDWGTVLEIAVHNPSSDLFIRSDETNDPQITQGEEVSIPAGEITYTLGN